MVPGRSPVERCDDCGTWRVSSVNGGWTWRPASWWNFRLRRRIRPFGPVRQDTFVVDDHDRLIRWLAMNRFNTVDNQPSPEIQKRIEDLPWNRETLGGLM